MCFQLVVTYIVGFNQWKESSSNFGNANDFVTINAKPLRRKESLVNVLCVLAPSWLCVESYYSFALNGCGELYIESDR